MSTPDVVSVSVVIPFHGGEETLQRAIDSIVAQRPRPREIIVVDDASPTAVPELRSAIPLRVLHHAENRGIPAARNTGIRAADGEWLGFLDQDDEWAPDKLARQWPLTAAETGPPIVFGRLLHQGEGTRPYLWPPRRALRRLEQGGDTAIRALVRWGNAMPFVTLLVHRRTFEEHGMLDETLTGGSDDYEFVLRAAAAGVPIRCDGARGETHSAIHHFTGRNYSAFAPRWLNDNLRLIERLAAAYPAFERRKGGALAQTYYAFGRHHDRLGQVEAALSHYRRARRRHPAWIRPHLAIARLRMPVLARRGIEWIWDRLGL